MADLVYPPVIMAVKGAFRLLDLRISVSGHEHIPATGGAVLAGNHISYLDFLFFGYSALPARRRVRFMAKKSVFDHKIAGPLMRGMHHIAVDRAAGQTSYRQAVSALRAGEVVGVFPEATISRSFMVKDLKSGAARMAADAGVPLIPAAIWGSQRLWTKGRARTFRRHTPITIRIGAPIMASADHGETTNRLSVALADLVDGVQGDYPDSPKDANDRWWLPAQRGGTAPSLADAAAMDAPGRVRRESTS